MLQMTSLLSELSLHRSIFLFEKRTKKKQPKKQNEKPEKQQKKTKKQRVEF
jgi:hypothetical protein